MLKFNLPKKEQDDTEILTNLINMGYFICGKLKFDYPQYSTWSQINKGLHQQS